MPRVFVKRKCFSTANVFRQIWLSAFPQIRGCCHKSTADVDSRFARSRSSHSHWSAIVPCAWETPELNRNVASLKYVRLLRTALHIFSRHKIQNKFQLLACWNRIECSRPRQRSLYILVWMSLTFDHIPDHSDSRSNSAHMPRASLQILLLQKMKRRRQTVASTNVDLCVSIIHFGV